MTQYVIRRTLLRYAAAIPLVGLIVGNLTGEARGPQTFVVALTYTAVMGLISIRDWRKHGRS